MKAIVNGSVHTPFESIPDGVVIVDGHTIRAVGPRASTLIPHGAEIFDAQGHAIVPGLIDIHMYGNLGVSITGPDRVPEELPALARNLARFGVTGFLISPPIGDRAFVARVLDALADSIPQTRGGAAPLGIHLEGPWLDPERPGAFPQQWLHPTDIDEVRDYVQAAPGTSAWSRLHPIAWTRLLPDTSYVNTVYISVWVIPIFPMTPHTTR